MRFPRLGCVGWVTAVILFVAALGLVGYLWYHSTADIRQVEKEARALGIPPTWAEAGLVQSDPATRATFDALVALSDKTPSWTKDHYVEMPRIGEEPSQELRDHQGAIPPSVWAELSEKISHLSAKPVVRFANPQQYYTGKGMDFSQLRDLCRLFTERMLIVPLDHIPPLVLATSQTAQLVSPQSLIDQLIIDSMASMVAQGVARRLPELRNTSAGHDCAEHLRQLRTAQWNTRASVWIAQTTMMGYLPYNAFYSAYAAPFTFSFNPGVLWMQTKEYSKRILWPLGWRLRRADDMRFVLQHVVAYQASTDLSDLARRTSGAIYTPTTAQQFAGLLDVDSGIGSFSLIDQGFLRTMLSLDVVIAELEGSSLPIDCFSSPSAPIQPVIREGKRIGWYSVGPDGVDNGGLVKEDYPIPTDGTFGKPHFADEPAERSTTSKSRPVGMPPGVAAPPPVSNPPQTEVAPTP